jgi:hypothetical protein
MSGGQMVARELERTAGYRCVTREDLTATVNSHGELASRVTASIEKATHAYEQFSTLRRPYKALVRLALLECTREGDVAYLGYSGQLLIPGRIRFARVRLEASVELRTRMTSERLGLSEEQAREHIRSADEDRVRWGRFLYGRDIRDARLYDLCINMDRLSVATVCGVLVDLAGRPEFQPTAESQQALEDLWLATRVEAALAVHPGAGDLELGARVAHGQVMLEGPYLEDPQIGLVLETARAVPGVKSVEYRPGYVPALDFTW